MTFIDCSDATAAADDVYPTGRIENDMSIRKTVFSVTLRFDDVLEPSRLHDTLCTLLDMGDWRRLGGRLREVAIRKKKVLSIHVPRPYTASRPAIAYSHNDFQGRSIAEHELSKRLPEAQGSRAMVCSPAEDFRVFAAAPDLPGTVEGFLVPGEDRPLLSLCITSFADATLVAVAVPHIVMDAMALGEMMQAWSLVLAGRMDEVPPVVASHEDITYDAADPAHPDVEDDNKEPWVLEPVYLTSLSFVVFVVCLLWAAWTGPAVESRSVYIPRRVLDVMHATAVEEITAQSPRDESSGEDVTPWVSEGDVLLAWACRIVSLAQGSRVRPINAHNAMNLRNRLPETTPRLERAEDIGSAVGPEVLARNLITLSYMPVSPGEARGPLGLVASKYRAALAAQTSPVQIRRTLRVARACVDAGKDANLIYGVEPTGELLTMTNWVKADLAHAVDFAPAVITNESSGVSKQGKRPGRIVYLHGQLHARSPHVRNALGVIGKDLEGNIWLAGYFEPRTWDILQKEIEKMNNTSRVY